MPNSYYKEFEFGKRITILSKKKLPVATYNVYLKPDIISVIFFLPNTISIFYFYFSEWWTSEVSDPSVENGSIASRM